MFEESMHVELKREVTEDLKKEVIAFANTEGGSIYIGIEDDGSIVGLENIDSEISKISNMLRDSIRPDVTMFVNYSVETINGKEIIKIEVSTGVRKPYYIYRKGLKPTGVYIRQGFSSVPATEDNIRKMIKDSDGDSFEKMRSIDQELTFNYAKQEFEMRDLPLEDSNMISLGMITQNERMYTNLGLLLSDQAKHTIKIAVFKGITKEIFKDRRIFEGSILEQLTEAYQFIDQYNRTSSQIEGLYRQDKRDYPEVAIRETLLNAIVHREYSLSGSTLINIFDDRMEFITIGGLVSGISLNDIMLGVSLTRNEKLAGLFYRLKLVEAYGTGISKIIGSYKEEKLQPEFETSDNAFKVSLFNLNYIMGTENYSDHELVVMRLFDSRNKINRRDVEEALKVSQTMAGRVLKKLVEKGLVSKRGAGANTHYAKK